MYGRPDVLINTSLMVNFGVFEWLYLVQYRPDKHNLKMLLILTGVYGSALDPIDRSPFLPSWNLHKVELFSGFISHLDDISSWKCSWKCKSLQFKKKKTLIWKTVEFQPTTQMVQYTTPATKTLRICWIEVKYLKSTYNINPNRKKEPNQFWKSI